MNEQELRSQIETCCDSLSHIPGLSGKEMLEGELRSLAERHCSRFGENTCIALFGPTGCGKSRICNSLFRKTLTPVGYRRPTTTTPQLIVPEGEAGNVARSLKFLPFNIVELKEKSFGHFVMVDPPDIDSLRTENRKLAESYLNFADAVVVVLNPAKYADDSIWEYIRRFAQQQFNFVLVLNALREQQVLEDLKRKLSAEEIEVPIFTLPFQPSRDHELLNETDGLEALRECLRNWGRSDEIREKARKNEANRAASHLNAKILPWIEGRIATLSKLREDHRSAVNAKAMELRRGVPLTIDKHTAKELYNRLVENLEKIDPLRLPRRVISYPFRLVLEKLKLKKPPPSPEEEMSTVWDLNREAFISLALSLCEELHDLSSKAGFVQDNVPDEASLRARFQSFQDEFRKWLTQQVNEITESLSVGQRIRFYVAQTLIFGVVIGVEIQTGGLLTLTEIVTNSVLTPFAAKLVGMSLSSEESKRFQARAHERYMEEVCRVLKDFASQHTSSLDQKLSHLKHTDRLAVSLSRTLQRIGGAE